MKKIVHYSLAKFCNILKVKLKSPYLWPLFEQELEVIFVESLLACVLSQFSTPQSTTLQKKIKALKQQKTLPAFLVYFNFDGSAKMPSFNFLRKSLFFRNAVFRCKRPFMQMCKFKIYINPLYCLFSSLILFL